jgi:K+-transporting ATPase ATPase A chain
LVSALLMLGLAGVSALFKPALDSLGAARPHGLTEIVYAYASSVADSNSAFAGLNANTPWYNVTAGLEMFFARFVHAIPVLAIAGSLAAKKQATPSAGTVPTHDATFMVFLLGVIATVTGLPYLPALTLGPIAEQVLGADGATF